MIPPLTSHGYLPPYTGVDPTADPGMAPYKATIAELAQSFATTPDRVAIFKGLLEFRNKLRNEGFDRGFQWIDGSYVELCEITRGRSPDDIDVVTFFYRPNRLRDMQIWTDYFNTTFLKEFDHHDLKSRTRCDAYFEDLDLPGYVLVSRARYWFGLFSHIRSTHMWKGLIEVPLSSNDSEAWDWINAGHRK